MRFVQRDAHALDGATAGPERIAADRLDDPIEHHAREELRRRVASLERRVVVSPSAFESKSVNTPFGGWTLRGGPVMTIVGGRIVHDAR